MDPTKWKHRVDGGGLGGREAGAFFLTASRIVRCICQRMLLPRTRAPPQQSSSVASELSAQPSITSILETHNSLLVSSAFSTSDTTFLHASVILASPTTVAF